MKFNVLNGTLTVNWPIGVFTSHHHIPENLPEEWRIVPSYPCLEASSHAKIRHTATKATLAFWTKDNGYRLVTLALPEGHPKKLFVHHLIAEAFHGVRPIGYEIDHINGCKIDNRPENLRYVLPDENRKNRTKRDDFLKRVVASIFAEFPNAKHENIQRFAWKTWLRHLAEQDVKDALTSLAEQTEELRDDPLEKKVNISFIPRKPHKMSSASQTSDIRKAA